MEVAVVGASGFVGQELVRVLAGHPQCELVAAQANQRAGTLLEALIPGLDPRLARRELEPIDPERIEADLAFLALPHGASAAIAARLAARGLRVVDLGADLRLATEVEWERWYGTTHGAPELLGQACVGVVEFVRDALASATIWAVPGCFVTASVLGAAPLVRAGVVDPRLVVVDAISGVSGAGSAPSPATHFVTVAEGVKAYGLRGHRHVAELRALLGAGVRFTPHVGPYVRGISATVTMCLREPLATEDVVELLTEAYRGSPFVTVREEPASTREVRGTNRAILTPVVDGDTGTVVVVSVVDNLGKGAAGHAVQGANVMLGLAEDAGLGGVGVWP